MAVFCFNMDNRYPYATAFCGAQYEHNMPGAAFCGLAQEGSS